MQHSAALADTVEGQLNAMQAEVQACLALNRAMLRALAALSPLISTAADAALEEEVEQAEGSERAVEIIEQVRDRVQRAPAEARLADALERALIAAADDLPPQDPSSEQPLRWPLRRTG